MKTFRWDPEKNNRLKSERGVSFEQIVVAIEKGGLKALLEHPNPKRYPGQRILVVALGAYAFLVPFVEEMDFYFLKTIIPSRKAIRDFLGGTDED